MLQIHPTPRIQSDYRPLSVSTTSIPIAKGLVGHDELSPLPIVPQSFHHPGHKREGSNTYRHDRYISEVELVPQSERSTK
jgi:hypothetical protein